MKLLVAGGGTGGHLFPGIAVADEFRSGADAVLFVGTSRGIEVREVPRAGYPLALIAVTGLKGKGIGGWLRGLLRLPRALWQATALLRRFKPDVVLGVGGYASGPVAVAAWALRIPIAIQEQNALAGLTNRWLGRVARVVFTAFPETAVDFSPGRVRQLGNPIRRQLLEGLQPDAPKNPEHVELLVVGGSQGAHALNQMVPTALATLPTELLSRLSIVHQTGRQDLDGVRRAYAQAGLRAQVTDFIVEMASAYARADLVIARAGASTLAELAVCRRAAILIPFPQAANDHQRRNAQAWSAVGAAVICPQGELDPASLAGTIRTLLEDRPRLTAMQRAAGQLARPRAAQEIAQVLRTLARRPEREESASETAVAK